MRNTMKEVNCKVVRDEIEEAGLGDSLSLVADNHLSGCGSCRTFRSEREKLRTIVAGLGTVEAPSDFDFRLRARLAGDGNGNAQSFSFGSLSFGFRSAAFVATALVIGAAVMFMSSRMSNTNSVAVTQAPVTTAAVANNPVKPTDVAVNASSGNQILPAVDSSDRMENRTSNTSRHQRRSGLSRTARPTQSREFAASQAPVYRTAELTASASDFPIAASNGSLKVSLENGRGSSRTISLPTISFGSQRVLSQNNSTPLMASARGAW